MKTFNCSALPELITHDKYLKIPIIKILYWKKEKHRTFYSPKMKKVNLSRNNFTYMYVKLFARQQT